MSRRHRSLSPDFFDNEGLADLPPHARLLFESLWVQADREGRLEDRPRKIHVRAFPYEPTLDIVGLLNGLERTGFVRRYEVEGVSVLLVVNFLKWQRPHPKERPSVLPPPLPGEDAGFHEKNGSAVKRNVNKLDSRLITDHCSGSQVTDPRLLIAGSGEQQRSKASPSTPSGFDQFWVNYPRKVGKAKCIAIWKRKDLHLQAATITQAVADQLKWPVGHGLNKASTESNNPHPATWLNEQRWDDEPPHQPDLMEDPI